MRADARRAASSSTPSRLATWRCRASIRDRTNCGSRRELLLGRLREEPQVARLQVRVQPIRALAAPVERPEQSAFVHVERRRRQIAGPYRRVDVLIVVRPADVDIHIAGVELDVLVAADALDAE